MEQVRQQGIAVATDKSVPQHLPHQIANLRVTHHAVEVEIIIRAREAALAMHGHILKFHSAAKQKGGYHFLSTTKSPSIQRCRNSLGVHFNVFMRLLNSMKVT